MELQLLWDMEGVSGLFAKAQAWYWDVPLVLVQGNEAACREAETEFPGVLTAAVKRAVNAERCTGLTPEAERRLTAQKVAEAVKRRRTTRPKPTSHVGLWRT